MQIETQDGMFQIASVSQLRKQKGRYAIYKEGTEEPVLSVHEDIIIKYRLLKGAWVKESDLPLIRAEDDRHRAYSLAVSYLGTKPRTRKEIERYLARKELEPDTIALIADRLEAERIVDDADYAVQFARQRARSQGKGRLRIKQELLQRGISRTQAADAVEALDPGTELKAAVKAAAKKWPYMKGEFRERKMKLSQFLMRRGYTGETVRKAIQEVIRESDEQDETDWLDN
ncbi:RecX family transcriptional regulator [Paenibacillus tarimensis]|uniref:RecX family transcriptional regulator n=1 Tax=Paenibacillus tarimensis TaxID=416012 RepID=UPI001F240A12|nr:RecX family transcriptional regulator [Paenibacillus tarimensis]MCF2942382.1 RecX family transcriptional regulator [Paenibacillus tarimensis]